MNGRNGLRQRCHNFKNDCINIVYNAERNFKSTDPDRPNGSTDRPTSPNLMDFFHCPPYAVTLPNLA